MARVMLVLTHDEVECSIAYRFICETMLGSAWSTSRRRRRWSSEFSEAERKAFLRLRDQATKWYLRTGVPDEVTMTVETLGLWQRLEAFCASL